MTDNLCGAPTQKGTACKLLARECDYHTRWRAAHPAQAPIREEQPAAVVPSDPVNRRDLRELGWWLVDRMVSAELPTPNGSVIASVMRILASLGPEPMAQAEALKQVELRGRIMHGQPPRTPEEWERAEAIFDDDALAEFHRWDTEIERLLAGSGDEGRARTADYTTAELFGDPLDDAFAEPLTPV